jgi:hypothetical protein
MNRKEEPEPQFVLRLQKAIYFQLLGSGSATL